MRIERPTLASLFGRSPFKPLQEHMRVVLACARQIPILIDALIAADSPALNAAKDAVRARENEADKIKNELRNHLPKSLFMPVDRRDLLEVLHMQDSIADTAEDIADLLDMRPMKVPQFMALPLSELTHLCVETCEQALTIVEELDELLELGFRGREAERVEDMVAELNRIEDQTDDLGRQLTGLLFAHEKEIDPVSVMMWYQIIEWTGDLADYAEKVGDRLRLLIAR